MGQPLWKAVWRFLRKLKIELLFDTAIESLLGLYPKNPDHQFKHLYISMFIAALFTTDKSWKQLKCPSVNEWIRKTMACSHDRILCSREKEGAPTLHDSMDGTGEHYVK